MRAVAIVAVLVAAGLAGCVTGDEAAPSETAGTRLDADAPTVELAGMTYDVAVPAIVSASVAAGDSARYEVNLTLPEGFWDTHHGALRLSASPHPWGDLDATVGVELPDGAGPADRYAAGGVVFAVRNAVTGTYAIEVKSQGGSHGPFDVGAVLDAWPKDAPAQEQVPNLVALPPWDVGFDTFWPTVEAPGRTACQADEAAEDQAERCLRFTSAVLNGGSGPLEVRLSVADGVASAAGLGQFMQRIYKTDGSWDEQGVAGAEFHAVHGHFHYEALARFALHAHDEATGERGPVVAEAGKAGFCLIDIGIAGAGIRGAGPDAYGGTNCFVPEDYVGDWFMGVSPGWYDAYVSDLSDQYVDVAGVPDGVYELVVTANPEQTLVETSYGDNTASTILRLSGDTVEVLGHKRAD